MFELHKQLATDCLTIGDLPLCRVLLMNDCQYPWCILVPRRESIREAYQLSLLDQQQLSTESNYWAAGMARLFHAQKMNIAALGNVVPQLHIHHIARFENDPSWPAPVWGKHTAVPYTTDELGRRTVILQTLLDEFTQ